MRTLSLLALLTCLALWLVGLWLGRPWPVTIAFLAPGALQEAFTPRLAPDPSAPPDEGATSPPRPHKALLTPRAGAAHVQQALACAPTHLTVQVQPGGREAIAVGWPTREDGYGVVRGEGTRTFTPGAHGRVPGPVLQLTSLGRLFAGTTTVEVTPRCDE